MKLRAAVSMAAFAACVGAPLASASAQTANGFAALALAGVVAPHSPVLTHGQKTVLAHLFDGQMAPPSHQAVITVTADAVVCRAGDVDITAFGCDLTFGTKKVHLSGRHANEVFATLRQAGVSPDGAAGTIFEALHAMSCTIDPAAIAQRAGGGASCTYQQGPS